MASPTQRHYLPISTSLSGLQVPENRSLPLLISLPPTPTTRPVVVQSFIRVRLFVTPWTAARQASLSFTISRSLLKLTSMESAMPSNHLILCRPLLLLPSIFTSIRVFSNDSLLHIRRPKHWSFSFSISPCNEAPGLEGAKDWAGLHPKEPKAGSRTNMCTYMPTAAC